MAEQAPHGDAAPAPPAAAVVGARVLLGGRHRATVRYVGPLEGQGGTWVGLEYDEADRGKHDGSHAGRRYFQCSLLGGPTAGSFVRLPKFLEAADAGRSLVAAARERYSSGGIAGSTGQGTSALGSEEGVGGGLYVTTAGNRRLAVELLAPAAASRRASAAGAALAVLVDQAISSVGPADELRAALPSLTELDLSDNLIASWHFVAELAGTLPGLLNLNLSRNRLALPGLGTANLAPAASWAGLQTLVLNSCGVTWPQAVAVARQLPILRELRLCGNRLATLALPAAGSSGSAGSGRAESSTAAAAAGLGGLFLERGAAAPSSSSSDSAGAASHTTLGTEQLLAASFPQLELLDLEENELSSWHADVAPLRGLPHLKALLLSCNRLEDVQYSGGFTSLRSLLLGSNRLSSWAAVDQLDAFPALEEARLSDNPLSAGAPGAARYQCIARVSRLTVLNASAVSAAERWDAEVNYLRLVTDELAAAGSADAEAGSADVAAAGAARDAILAANPRFETLTRRYGELTPAAPKAAAGSALGSSMAAVVVCHNGKPLQKKLPVSLTVGKLKLMLERLLRVKASQQALLLVPPEASGAQPEDITDEDARDLRYFDVCDGCRLEVSRADAGARAAALAAAKAAAAAAHAARMEQHEKTIQQFRSVEQRMMA